MFKKKASLPDRPPIPNNDEIMEDINRATSVDAVFKYLEEITPLKIEDAVGAKEDSYSLEQIDPKDPFYNYKMITVYVEKIENLIKYHEEIKNGRDGLQHLTKGLLEDMVKVRKELKEELETAFENL